MSTFSTPSSSPLIINRNEWRKTSAEKEVLKDLKRSYKFNRNKERFGYERNVLIKAILDSPVPNWGNVILNVK